MLIQVSTITGEDHRIEAGQAPQLTGRQRAVVEGVRIGVRGVLASMLAQWFESGRSVRDWIDPDALAIYRKYLGYFLSTKGLMELPQKEVKALPAHGEQGETEPRG